MTEVSTDRQAWERKQFVTVSGISNSKRLPRIGRIRLGVKREKGGKTFPAETDYFVVEKPDANAPIIDRALHAKFVEIYGDTPRALDILLPSEDREVFAPQAYKCYGAASLKCIGDGAEAMRLGSDGKFAAVNGGCPGPDACQYSLKCGQNGKPGCKFVASIFVILPKVSLGGSFQIVTGSKNAALSLSASIDAIRRMFGHVAGLAYIDPETGQAATALRIVRRPVKMQYEGKSRVHYPVSIESSLTIDQVLKLQRAGVLGAGMPNRQACVRGTEKPTAALPAKMDFASVSQPVPATPSPAETIQDDPDGVDLETGEVLSEKPAAPDDDPFGDSPFVGAEEEQSVAPARAVEQPRLEQARLEQSRIEQERLNQARLEVASLLAKPADNGDNSQTSLSDLIAAIDGLNVKASIKSLLRKKAEQCPDVVRDELIKMGRLHRRAA